MTTLETLKEKFEALQSGDYSVTEVLFETIWGHFSWMAVDHDARLLLDELCTWVNAHEKEHPDIYRSALLTRGGIALLQDRFTEAETLLNKSKELFLQNEELDGAAAASVCIGILYRSMGELDLALKNGLPALDELRKSNKFQTFRGMGSYWIGSLYTETGHLEEALRIFEEGMSLHYLVGEKNILARLTGGLAQVYVKQKKYNLALSHFEKALDLANELSESVFRSRGLTDLADYYFETGDFAQAIKYNKEALSLRREMKQLNPSITNLVNLGRIYFKQGDYPIALKNLFEAKKIAEEINVKVKIYQIHQLLSDIYLATGDLSLCLGHFKNFHEIKEEVNHEDIERKVKNQVQLFKAEQTEKENAIIKAQKIEIENAKRRSDELLYNILPEEVAEEIKSKGNAEARQYNEVTVLFTDFKNFTGISEKMTPKELVEEIHTFFKAFDEIIESHGIEKIKTIGDSYMCVAGLPVANHTHALDIVKAGLEIRNFVEARRIQRVAEGKDPFLVRIGIHTGPVVAGIVGIKKFAYDIWGDTVNTASRMESSGEVGKVNISETTYALIKNQFHCTYRGKIEAKGKGEIEMYFVDGEV